MEMNKHPRALIILISFFSFFGCSDGIEDMVDKVSVSGDTEIQESELHIHITGITDQTERTSEAAIQFLSVSFADNDSILVANITNGTSCVFYYSIEDSCFSGLIPLSVEDEIALLYPVPKCSITDNRIVLNTSNQIGDSLSASNNDVFWGFAQISDNHLHYVDMTLFDLMSRMNVVFTDQDGYPLSLRTVTLSTAKGGIYSDRILNLKTGQYESGNTNQGDMSFVADVESSYDRGCFSYVFFPTSVMSQFIVEDTKGSIYEATMSQKIWHEGEVTFDTIECNLVEQALEYVEVCGVKWAKGNLQYNEYRKGDKGFAKHWLIADRQYEYFNPVYGHINNGWGDTIQYDERRLNHFNWGVVGEKVFNVNARGSHAANTAVEISAKMFTNMVQTIETKDFNKALYGDLPYWASRGKYRLPTSEELHKLYSEASYAFGYAPTDDGKWIMGCLFWTPSTEKREEIKSLQYFTKKQMDACLFLPAAGFRQSFETTIMRVGNGFYWDSYMLEKGGVYALRFVITTLYWSIDGNVFGRSIRPVLCD